MHIVSLAPSVTEILFALGLGDQIVANTSYCDYPVEAKKIPKVGGFSTSRLPKILEFKPDIVITSTVVQNEAKEWFKEVKLKHIHLDPRSLSDIYKDILTLGRELKVEDRAEEIINDMKRKAEMLKEGIPGQARDDGPADGSVQDDRLKPRVYIEEWFDPPMGSGNWVPDIVEIAGGIYNLVPEGEISQEIPFHKIKSFNPQVIFVAYCGYQDKSDLNKILKRPDWEEIEAVRSKRVFPIDDRLLNRPGPRALEAAELMQKFLSFTFG